MGRRSGLVSSSVFAALCVATTVAGAQSLPQRADDERVPVAREAEGESALVVRSTRAGEDRARLRAPWAAAVFGGLYSGLFHWGLVAIVARQGGQWEPWVVPTIGPVIAAGITVAQCPESSVCQDIGVLTLLGGALVAVVQSFGAVIVTGAFDRWSDQQRHGLHARRIPRTEIFAAPGAGTTPLGLTVGVVTF